MTADTPRLRLGVLGIVAVSLLGALFARLWYLQVMAAPEFRVAAESNRIRVVATEAPRGRILDRDGTPIVENRDSIVVTVDRQELDGLDNADAVLQRLADAVTRDRRRANPIAPPVTVDELEETLADPRYSRFQPVPVAEDVTEELEIFLRERAAEYPAVEVERRVVRAYPYGALAAHLLGYVGPVIDEDLEERADSPKPYQLGDEIGKGGVERAFEEHLRGTPGEKTIEVNVDNEPVRVLETTEPVAGDDVWLTIDLEVQAVAELALFEELEDARGTPLSGRYRANSPAGSVVVLDPQAGGLVAMASFPTYDPGEFLSGISRRRFAELTDPANYAPFTNRAIQGEYAPGSTFKLFTAYAALSQGLLEPTTTISDGGSVRIGDRTFRNSGTVSYGAVNLEKSLRVSSDVYYYLIGRDFWEQQERFGEEALQEGARAFGLGEQTGIALPGERSGRIPTPAERARIYDENPGDFLERDWFTGDNVNTAIGQGDVLVTPLQLANAYATFANGGTRHSPNVAQKITRHGSDEVVEVFEPRVVGQVDLPPQMRQPMLDGLTGVTNGERGTAVRAFSGFPHTTWPVAGKTGTAEVNGKADSSVFAGFGPTFDPRYVAVAVLEESGFGGNVAAPLVRRIFEPIATNSLPAVQPGGLIDPAALPDAPESTAGPQVLD
ncbi:penicillin-binding protein 2 [soil metagenome]